MTDLETSVMEEEKLNTIETLANTEENDEDESFLSQSLLAKKKQMLTQFYDNKKNGIKLNQ